MMMKTTPNVRSNAAAKYNESVCDKMSEEKKKRVKRLLRYTCNATKTSNIHPY